MWTCPTCGLKGDYGLEEEDDRHCPLCHWPEKHTAEEVGAFRAFATLYDKSIKLSDWWYEALWDEVTYTVIKKSTNETVRFLFENRIRP